MTKHIQHEKEELANQIGNHSDHSLHPILSDNTCIPFYGAGSQNQDYPFHSITDYWGSAILVRWNIGG